MKTLYINQEKYPLRQSWQECTTDMLIAAITLANFIDGEKNPKKRAHFWVGLMRVLLEEVPAELFAKIKGVQLYDMKRHFQWVLPIQIDFQPFQSFEHEEITYLLPAPNFSDTTAIELAMANIYYLNFTNADAANPEAVLHLIATLCRPQRVDIDVFRASKDWNNDAREEYNSIKAEERAINFKTLPIGVVVAIFKYFESMNGAFLQRYQSCFEGGDPNTPPLYQNGEGWLALLEDVAETGIHGTFKEVCNENVHTVFLYIRHKTLKNKQAATAQTDEDDD